MLETLEVNYTARSSGFHLKSGETEDKAPSNSDLSFAYSALSCLGIPATARIAVPGVRILF